MKKSRRALLTVLIVAVCAVAALAAGLGSAGDPLISLSYLNNTYTPGVLEEAQAEIDRQGEDLLQEVLAGADQTPVDPDSLLFAQDRVKAGDVYAGGTGAGFLLLAGEVLADCGSGTLINVTTGQEVTGSASLAPSQRYLVAEDSRVRFTILSDTAVVEVEGPMTLTESNSVNYNAAADTLRSLGLFRGGDLGYGSGYMLEQKPTRIEGLIMFLRLLGEEDAALACTIEQPFSDVPAWCAPYVAYAYDKGYSNGVGGGRFGTTNLMTATEYMTLVLRSLGYDSGEGGDFAWDQSIPKAHSLGLLTPGEFQLLTDKPFYRAQTAYISYHLLSAPLKNSSVHLSDKLIDAGIFTRPQYNASLSQAGDRLP